MVTVSRVGIELKNSFELKDLFHVAKNDQREAALTPKADN